MRVIGILSLPYNGSTVLSRIFSALPQVASVGEIAWLVDRGSKPRCGPCLIAGRECPVFTEEFMSSVNASNLYSETLKRFAPKYILVSSDKSMDNYDRYVFCEGGVRTMDGVVVYRHPMAWMQSSMLRGYGNFESNASVYAGFYGRVREWAAERDVNLTFVSLQQIIKNWRKSLRRIAHDQHLAVPDFLPPFASLHYHHVLGNQNCHTSSRLKPDNAWQQKDGDFRIPKETNAVFEMLEYHSQKGQIK